MSQDIVADIVRRALAPEPVGDDGRPRETPLEERLRLLHNALGGTQQRVTEQQHKLAALRSELDEYRALMERVKQKAVEAQRAADLLAPAAPAQPTERARAQSVDNPATECARAQFVETPRLSQAPAPLLSLPLDSAAGGVDLDVPVPVPAPALAPRPLEDALTPRLRWPQLLPYAAIVVFGAAMSYVATRRPAPAAASLPALRAAAAPSPSLTAEAPEAAAAASAPDAAPAAEDVSNAVVLSLISSFVPPGGKRSVSDILGPEMDDPESDSPWTMMSVDPHTVLVSFHPYGDVIDNAPVYEFTVDPLAKTVTASDETLAALRGGVVTAAR